MKKRVCLEPAVFLELIRVLIELVRFVGNDDPAASYFAVIIVVHIKVE